MSKMKEVYKNQLEMASIRLVKDAPLMSKSPVEKPEDAIALLGSYLSEMDREIICVINLRSDGVPINCSVCSMGAVNQALAHPREILKTAILSNAANIILAHNHPSGNLTPSKEDIAITERMATACEILGIPLLDHIIVGGDNKGFYSFREKDILPMKQVKLKSYYKNLNMDAPGVAEDHVRRKHHR